MQASGGGSSGHYSHVTYVFAPTASNLFAFDQSRTVTVNFAAPALHGKVDVRVALHDSPDKQLAQKLAGRSLALELLFRLVPAGTAPPPAAPTPPHRSAHDVTWGAAVAALVACALIAFATAGFAPVRVKSEERS
jgi:hypothetical protein